MDIRRLLFVERAGAGEEKNVREREGSRKSGVGVVVYESAVRSEGGLGGARSKRVNRQRQGRGPAQSRVSSYASHRATQCFSRTTIFSAPRTPLSANFRWQVAGPPRCGLVLLLMPGGLASKRKEAKEAA